MTSSFAYNPASQVVHKNRNNDLYRFNAYPNTPVSRAYGVNGLNQYSSAGSSSFTYDANGNLTGSSNPTDGAITYSYDVENRLLGASGPVATTLQYDPLGRLWRLVAGGVTSEFTYDGDAMVAVTSGGAMQRFVHGNRDDDPLIRYDGATLTNRYSLQADAQGSIVSMASASGALSGSILSYDEYGIPGTGNDGVFQYTGQMWLPSLGIYYYKARIYSPTLGRFLQIDPIGYKDQNNLYAYVGNDPIDGQDPTGLMGGAYRT